MTDRELLWMAAKAAGIDVPNKDGPWAGICNSGFPGAWWDTSSGGDGTQFRQWSPLTDDGDALRLAVKLELALSTSRPSTACGIDTEEEVRRASVEPHKDDPYAATRRAIVRAAAEIGKAMP